MWHWHESLVVGLNELFMLAVRVNIEQASSPVGARAQCRERRRRWRRRLAGARLAGSARSISKSRQSLAAAFRVPPLRYI